MGRYIPCSLKSLKINHRLTGPLVTVYLRDNNINMNKNKKFILLNITDNRLHEYELILK